MTSLLDISIRHQIYLEGLKRGRQPDLANCMASIQGEVLKLIQNVDYDNLGELTKVQLNLLLARLMAASNHIFAAWITNTIQWLKDYMEVDRDFWQFGYTEYKTQDEPDDKKDRNYYGALFGRAPDRDRLYSLVRNQPMGANGVLIEPFINGFGTLGTAKIAQAVKMVYADNGTKADAIASIVGTKGADFKDGLLQQLARQGNAVTGTIIQHAAGITNANVGKQGFAQYLWISVLDSRTTQICISRNGHVYIYGQGPLPPAHIGCRSSTIAWDGTGPITMPTFTVWVNGQSSEFRNDAFDGEAGPSYDGSAPIDLDEFKAKRSLILA